MTQKNGNKAIISMFIGLMTLIITGLFMIRFSDMQVVNHRFDRIEERMLRLYEKDQEILLEIVQRLASLERNGQSK